MCGLNGVFHQTRPDGTTQMEFRYTVVRVWEQPVEALLGGELTGLPLAPLALVDERELPEVLRRIDRRLRAEALPRGAARSPIPVEARYARVRPPSMPIVWPVT